MPASDPIVPTLIVPPGAFGAPGRSRSCHRLRRHLRRRRRRRRRSRRPQVRPQLREQSARRRASVWSPVSSSCSTSPLYGCPTAAYSPAVAPVPRQLGTRARCHERELDNPPQTGHEAHQSTRLCPHGHVDHSARPCPRDDSSLMRLIALGVLPIVRLAVKVGRQLLVSHADGTTWSGNRRRR